MVIHESQVPPEIAALPREKAIRIGADAGFTVHLAGKHAVPTRSGDPTIRAEISALLKRYPAEDVLVFLTLQRHIGSDRQPDLKEARASYHAFYRDYLAKSGFPEQKGWSNWEGFLDAYRHVTGHTLTTRTWDRDLASPIHNKGRLSEMARVANAFRDGHLVGTIRNVLSTNDRILVTFGSWHLLSLELVLEDELFPASTNP